MLSKLDFPLHGPAVNIVRRCGGPALSAVLESKFGCVATIDGVDFEGDQSAARQTRPTVAQEKRFEAYLAAGIKVSVWKADLTNFQADAVVNAANEHLQHWGGLALALSEAGGPQIQQESDNYISRHGSLRTGDAVIFDGGLLRYRKIIHAVGPHLPKYPSSAEVGSAEMFLRRAIRSILEKVAEHNLKSVAIPAISSGLFNYPLPQCANTIVKTVAYYYQNFKGHYPKEIMLVNHDEPTVREMERACAVILAPSQPFTYSQAAAGTTRSDAKTSPLTVQMGKVSLTLKRGRIEEQQTDVIVSATYNQNLMSGEISRALLQKAGPGLRKEIESASLKGSLIVTKAYKLHCKEVYHTCCTEMRSDTAQQDLFRSVSECLHLAASKHRKSVAFPAIGTGDRGFDKEEVAQIMSHAVSDFAHQALPNKMEVYFVIYPSDNLTFQAFEEHMRNLKRHASGPSFTYGAVEHKVESEGSGAPTPQISLIAPSNEATQEAERWLHDLFNCSGCVVIHNNLILHLGEKEHMQLSRLMEKEVSIEESFERGRASIIVQGESNEDVVVAGMQVEAMLCNIQREFVKEKEDAVFTMLTQNETVFKRTTLRHNSPEFTDRLYPFKNTGLRIVKVDQVENLSLNKLFGLKKKQLSCNKTEKMFQCIPAQFCEMVSHIGFHAEFAPPDDPAYGEGIYFTNTVKKALDVWKEPNKEYVHFVEAEVLTGKSTAGTKGLILPPAVGTDPHTVYNSVTGPEISVIFSGYQALPKYIITCKICTA